MSTPTTLAVLALPLLLVVFRTAAPPAGPAVPAVPAAPAQSAPPGVGWTEGPGQLIFFAVLEGLYVDGVQPELVRAVLQGPEAAPAAAVTAVDPAENAWAQHLERTLFVPACPLCTPVQVAFELYAARGPLHLKGYHADGRPLDSFGPGLPDAVATQLRSADRAQRLAALEGLVTGWIERRLDRQRATPDERESLRHWMEDGRKQGMNQLAGLRGVLDEAAAASWPRCASCDASVAACEPR